MESCMCLTSSTIIDAVLLAVSIYWHEVTVEVYCILCCRNLDVTKYIYVRKLYLYLSVYIICLYNVQCLSRKEKV